MDDPESEDTELELWRSVLEHLRADGASRAEALDGANLVLTAHLRRRRTPPERMREEVAEDEPGESR